MQETGNETSAARVSTVAIKLAKNSSVATASAKVNASERRRGLSISSLQAKLLLQLLGNKKAARKVIALYLALVSEVGELAVESNVYVHVI